MEPKGKELQRRRGAARTGCSAPLRPPLPSRHAATHSRRYVRREFMKCHGNITQVTEKAVAIQPGKVSGRSADEDAKRVAGRVGVDPQRLLRVM